MADNETARLLNEIGNLLAEDTAYPLDGTFVYVEAASMMASIAVFKDLGDHLLYRWFSTALGEAIIDLWDAAPDDEKWATMEYRIQDGQVEASFLYPDEIDPEEDLLERRDRIVQSRYGNKKVVYPSIE